MDLLTVVIILSIVSAIIAVTVIYKKILPLIFELEKTEQKKLNELEIFIEECKSDFNNELQVLNNTSKTYLPEYLFEKHQDIILNIDFISHFHLIGSGEGTTRTTSYFTHFDGTWDTTYAIYHDFFLKPTHEMILFNHQKNIKSSQKKPFDLVMEKALAFSLIYIVIKKFNEKIKDKANEIGINNYPQEASLKRMKELVFKAANKALNFAMKDYNFSKDDIKLFFPELKKYSTADY